MAAATDPVRDFVILTTQALQNRERVVDLQTLASGLLGLPPRTGAAERAGYQMSEIERNNPVQFFFLYQLVAIIRGHLPPRGAAGTPPSASSQPPDTPGPVRPSRRARRADAEGTG